MEVEVEVELEMEVPKGQSKSKCKSGPSMDAAGKLVLAEPVPRCFGRRLGAAWAPLGPSSKG